MPRPLALLCLLFALAAAASPAQPAARVLADYAGLQQLYPRPEGSAAERGVLRQAEERLRELGVPTRRLDFRESDQNHSFSEVLVASVAGQRRDTLLLAVPLDHPAGASRDRDGSINVALALGLLEAARARQPALSLEVLFLGAEFGEGPQYPMGSRLFLRNFTPVQPVMVMYLNLRAVPSRLAVRAGGRGLESPFWLIDRTTRALAAAGLFFRVRGNETQIFRIGLTDQPTVIEPYLNAGYPAVSLEGEYEGLPAGGEEAWVASFLGFLEGFGDRFREGIPETWDRHYLFFQLRSFYFPISEPLYVVLLIAVLAGTLLYSLVATRRLRRYLRLLGRDLWILPLYFLFIFLLLFLASWALEGVQRLRNSTDLWTHLPLPFLAFKLAVPLLLFFAFLPALRRLRVPLRGGFYSAAALLCLLADIVVLAAIDISFSYYFLWAFACALLFTASSSRIVKLLAFLASPYWILKAVLELFSLPVLRFCRVVLLSKLSGNLLLAAVLLPFILMYIRLHLVLPWFRISSRRTRRILSASLFGAILAGLAGFFLLYSPYGPGRPQPVTAEYLIDRESGQTRVELDSPASLRDLYLLEPGALRVVDTWARSTWRPLPQIADLVAPRLTEVGFLDRKNIHLALQPVGSPVRIRLSVSAPEEFVLYDANFPYQREPDGKRYTLLIGVNPPLPLDVQLTLPQDRSFQVGLELEYSEPPAGFEAFGDRAAVRSRLTYRMRMEFKT